MNPKDRIIVSIDVDTLEKAESIIDTVGSKVGMLKMGKQLFTREGPKAVELAKKSGAELFLDLKYHDIPNTVAMAGIAAADMGVYMFNVHCSGGFDMMQTCVQKVESHCKEKQIRKPIIIGVTVLTSLNQESLEKMNINAPVSELALTLAKLGKEAGLDGVVCSAHESKQIKELCGNDFLTVVPGIRPEWASKNDQKRAATPRFAVENGADYLVIGRAITAQPDPVDAVGKIIEELS